LSLITLNSPRGEGGRTGNFTIREGGGFARGAHELDQTRGEGGSPEIRRNRVAMIFSLVPSGTSGKVDWLERGLRKRYISTDLRGGVSISLGGAGVEEYLFSLGVQNHSR